jgi:hypothetical protein
LLIDAATTFHFHAMPMIATHAMLPAVMLPLLLLQRCASATCSVCAGALPISLMPIFHADTPFLPPR